MSMPPAPAPAPAGAAAEEAPPGLKRLPSADADPELSTPEKRRRLHNGSEACGADGLPAAPAACVEPAMEPAEPAGGVAPSTPAPEVSEETGLAVCSVHGERVYLVCRDAGCRSALMCGECVAAHKGHECDDVEKVFDATKTELQSRVGSLQEQLEKAKRREVRAMEALDDVVASVDAEQVSVQLHYSTARIEEEQDVGRVGVAAEESLWRAMLQAHEAHERVVNRRERTGLQQVERLGRDEIMASRELQQENHRRLFRGGLERVALLGCIERLAQKKSLAEAALALPVTMPRTLQKRTAELSGLDTKQVPAECSVGAVQAAVWRDHMMIGHAGTSVKTPAVYSVGVSTAMSTALSPSTKMCCVCTNYGTIYVYDTSSGEMVARINQGMDEISCLSFSRCGKWLAATSDDTTIGVFRTATWEHVRTLRGHTSEVKCAGWTGSGKLVSSSHDKTMRLWDMSRGRCIRATSPRLFEHSPAIAVAQGSIFGTATDGKAIHKFDATSLQRTHILAGHSSDVFAITLTTDEQQLVSCSHDRTVKVWCTNSHMVLRSFWCQELLFQVSVSQFGDLLAVRLGSGMTQLMKLSTGERLGVSSGSHHGVVYSSCGRWVFTGTDNGVEVAVVEGSRFL